MRHLIDDLKQCLAIEIATINNGNMNNKFDKRWQRLHEMDRKVSETAKQAEDNKRQTDYLVQEEDSLSRNVEKQDRRISQLEVQIEDEINMNTPEYSSFRGIKHKNTKEMEWYWECSSKHYLWLLWLEERWISTWHR